jgi:hypothetical protein
MVPKYHVMCFLFSAVICGMADNSDLPSLKFYKASKMNVENFLPVLVGRHSTT